MRPATVPLAGSTTEMQPVASGIAVSLFATYTFPVVESKARPKGALPTGHVDATVAARLVGLPTNVKASEQIKPTATNRRMSRVRLA